MRVLFLDPEQYVSFDQEPSYYELRMPILGCGVVDEHRDFIYQRLVRQEGHDSMHRRLLREVAEFRPDAVVYSTTWPEYLIDKDVLRRIMDAGVPIYTHLWDTNPTPWPHELDTYLHCNYMGETGSVSNYLFYKSLAGNQRYLQDVVFTAGHNVFTDLFSRQDVEKTRDVTLLGSREGSRKELIDFLDNRLATRGFRFNKSGGLLDSEKVVWRKGLRLSDAWVPWSDYVREINRSKICLSSQSDPDRVQVKGKVFDFLACGALAVIDRNFEICKIVPDDCVVYYDGLEDCLQKVLYYLEHEDERRTIAERGHAWYHRTFDYKAFWSAIMTRVATGRGELPGLPGEALQREQEWTAQLSYLGPDVPTANAADSFAPILVPRARAEAPPSGAIPWERGTRVACSLPWYKLEIGLHGEYGPCCHYKVGVATPPSSKKELSKLWNSKGMLAVRQNLLDGKLAGTPCETCYDRMFATDHDIFGMGTMPRYSLQDPARDALWRQTSELYEEGRVVLPNMPIELNYFTSELCNLKCIMCTQNVDHSLQDTDRIVALLEEMGLDSFDRFSWVGGEPLLSRDALELLDYVTAVGPGATCIYITTNATLVHKHLSTLEKIDNLFLTVSLDGARETYEMVRTHGKWTTVRENLERLGEARSRHPNWRLNLNSVVMHSTYPHIDELIDLAVHVGASLFFMPINGGHPEEDFFAYPGVLRDPDAFRETVERGIERAGSAGAEKARDSLEKLLAYWELTRRARGQRLPNPEQTLPARASRMAAAGGVS